MNTAVLGFYEPERRSDVFRWSVAAVVVLAAHFGIAAAYLALRPEPGDRAQAPVVAVEFAPAPVEPPPAVEAAPEMVPSPPDEPEPPPQPQSPPETQAMVAPLPPSEQPAVEIPPPRPVPTEQPKPSPAHAPEQQRPVKSIHEPPKKPATATRAQPSRVATAPTAGAAAIGAREHASWLSELAAHLARYKRYPAEAEARHNTGTVRLSFTMDRGGRVVSRHIEGSSGSASLDQEALSMIERAQPLPVPPSMPQTRITLTVPIHFSLQGR
jgi:periplasmic protein TonB